MVSSRGTADVLIIGDGLIGLSTALELARRGATVHLVGTALDGAASPAAAGLLIPAIERLPEAGRSFYVDSLDRYPAFVESLRDFDPTLSIIAGMIERSNGRDVHRERDGAIDNVRLLAALRAAVATSTKISSSPGLVGEVARGNDSVAVRTHDGQRFTAGRAVLAAGAWSSQIAGLPRSLPVRPLKGQMIALGATPLRQAMMGEDVYLVPRGNDTLVGATVEEAGFDIAVTPDAVASLRASAIALCPELDRAQVTRTWAGTRPATPDMLPILGADPDEPALIYACGHSKNGVLLTPATAVAIAAVCLAQPTPTPIDAFSIARFS